MNVQILFFGATADTVGKREIILKVDNDARANQALSLIVDQNPGLAKHKLLFSINQEYARGDEILSDGDELAIFTAVSGG